MAYVKLTVELFCAIVTQTFLANFIGFLLKPPNIDNSSLTFRVDNIQTVCACDYILLSLNELLRLIPISGGRKLRMLKIKIFIFKNVLN